MNLDQKKRNTETCSDKNKDPSKIENLLNEIKDKGTFTLAHMNEESQVMITKWAQCIFDRFESGLENQPTKIKNIVDLPVSKEKVKVAIKILLTAYVLRGSDELVDSLKDRYVSIGAFQNIDLEDSDKKFSEDDDIKQELRLDYGSVFPEYHKQLEVVILEQNVLLDDVNNFINEIKRIKKKSPDSLEK